MLSFFVFIFKKTYKSDKKDRQGYLIGSFFVGMFTIRFVIEYLKESQGGLEDILGLFSTGQWLSIPLILFGFYLIFRQSKFFKE